MYSKRVQGLSLQCDSLLNMARPYSITLLNELHEHFPELLYRPTNFQNVGDVLNYVIGVARQNPYEAGREEYERTRNVSVAPPPSRTASIPRSAVVSNRFSQHSEAEQIYSALYGEPYRYTGVSGIGTTSIFRNTGSIGSSTSNPIGIGSSGSDPIMSFIGGLLGGSSAPHIGGISLTSFLDERVTVRPTEEQIQSASVLTILNPHSENCAICQDAMEDGQSVRILSHCIHRFHQDCIDTWFQSHVTCPTCRHDIRDS